MKNLFYLVGLLLLIGCAGESKAPTSSIINLTVKNSESSTAVIRDSEGFLQEMALDDTGRLTDTLEIPSNGYYRLIIGREATAVYLEQGKNLSLTLDVEQFDESLSYSGDLANENNYLAAKYLFDESFDFQEVYSKDEVEFVKEVSILHQGKLDLMTKAQIQNTQFIANETRELSYENAANLESYPANHKYVTKKTDFKVSKDFYNVLSTVNYADTTAFRNSQQYQTMLSTHYNRLANEKSEATDFNATVSYLQEVDAALPNGHAKEVLMTNYLQYGMRPDEGLDIVYKIYKNSAPSKKNLDMITERYQKMSTITKGKVSPTFEYENFAGGTTSLAQLKGKNVYIDVWATWCGPCIHEIPSLKALENDYRNKNLAFVSISIDEKKDYDKWRSMIPEMELGGIQLMAENAWKSKFIEAYGINGIPRFILLDTEGKIINADAPRPSDPKLRTLLDATIKA